VTGGECEKMNKIESIGLVAIIKSINNMTEKEIEQNVMKIPIDKNKQITMMVDEYCYDREYCQALNIPYDNIRYFHIQKLKVFSYNVLQLE
jgi:hypothetical protein